MDYRREIDGLRALAVIPVILFHAGFELFSGGFIGVDIFFVISGYLITTIILQELENGNFSIINFYERRARRILPALFFIMLVCLPFAWLWLLPKALKEFSDSLFAVSLFLSNHLFLSKSDYFDAAAELKPLLHTWSLAVEEQFYIFFPLLLIFLWKFGKRYITVVLIVIGLISLGLAQWTSTIKPEASFYLLPTRAWELLIGSLAAFYILKFKHLNLNNNIIKDLAGWIGLILIFYSLFNYDKTTPFPSVYTLAPTIGSVLIILFANQYNTIGKFIGNKLFISIGLISYSAYLWHQPLFAFARHRSLTEPSDLLFAILSIMTIVLAYFSWRFIELPFKNKNLINRKFLFTFTIFSILFFLIIGTIGHFKKGFENRFLFPNSFEDQFIGYQLSNKCYENVDLTKGNNKFCIFGSTENTVPSIALFGDSHSSAMNPLFDMIGKQKNLSYAYNGQAGCLPLLEIDIIKGVWEKGICRKIASAQYEYVKNNNIKTVILIARWSLYTQGKYGKKMSRYFVVSDKDQETNMETSRKVFKESFVKTVAAYENLGARVIVMLQAPQQIVDPKDVYSKYYIFKMNNTPLLDIINRLSVNSNQHLELQNYHRTFFSSINQRLTLQFVNPDNYLCTDNHCLMGTQSNSFYLDHDHLNQFGAIQLKPAFIDIFK